MAGIKAILFDLHGTLAYVESPVTDTEISEYLFNRGYEVSPQQLKAAWAFVSFIDYPKYGYKNWRSFFSRIFWRLKVKVDRKTLDAIAKLLESNPYQLYPDATEAVVKAKENGFKTAIVTTIAYFKFKKAVKPIRKCFDFVMTGYEAKCDKSNPKMYRRVLEILRVKPHEAVMIGDNMQLDILLPKRLGINTILLNRERKIVEFSQADATVNDLREAIEIVRKLCSKHKTFRNIIQ
ncbi:MAG: HAD family hydrolase [Candidatus Bathyarchaeota archaeon]|nr:HAD family hydrolase [Candidatus Bathyarchaeota archaeon]